MSYRPAHCLRRLTSPLQHHGSMVSITGPAQNCDAAKTEIMNLVHHVRAALRL